MKVKLVGMYSAILLVSVVASYAVPFELPLPIWVVLSLLSAIEDWPR
jgi:hypothetical protein